MWLQVTEWRRGGLTYSQICGQLAKAENMKSFGLVEVPSEDTIRRGVTRRLNTSSPTVVLSGGESHHEVELRDLLIQWLKLEEEVTLESWLQFITDHIVSPAGLLNLAQAALSLPSGDKTNDQVPSPNQVREELFENYAPQLTLSAPPRLIRSSQFAALRQHLEGDTLWEKYKPAEEALA